MTQKRQSVLIMAGGTGGHIFPGLAVAESLRDRGIPVSWLGAAGGMECERVPAAGIELRTVDISGIRGKGLVSWLALPWRLTRAVFQAFRHLGIASPACAVSFGGYAAGPGGLAAKLRGVPLLVHEQNRIPGMTNRVLAKMARVVLQAFPGSWPEKLNPRDCGNPVRRSVVELAAPDKRFEGRTGPTRLLITGGSQGALALNRLLPAALALLPDEDRPDVRHQAGRGRAEHTRIAYQEAGLECEVSDFIDDMAEAYGWADLVVCRAGALTVSELASAGLGSILVPFPHAVDDHQTRNAEFLVEAGAAQLMPESGSTPDALAELLAILLTDREHLNSMAVAARAVAIPDAAERVAALCQEFIPA